MTREEELQKIKDNSPYSLPDNPSESGWTAGQIKEKFWKGLFVLYDIINADRDELQTKLEQIDDAIDDFAGIAGVVAKARGDEDGTNIKSNYAKTAALVDGTIACLKYIKENGESGNIKDIEAAVNEIRTSLDSFISDKFTGEKAKKAIQADSAEIATKDVDGNPIKTTYAKQSSLDALLSMITAIGNGSSTVDKARKDQDGNRIDLTYIKKSNIVNDLNHDDVDLPLSAKQGKVLKEMAQGYISSTGDNVFGGNNSFTGTNTFSGVLNPNSNGKGLVMPDTSGYSADKTIATADKFDDYRTSAAQDVIDQATRDIAEGKTKAFSVDPTTTGNEALQSDNKTITLTSFEDVDGNTITVSELHKGDEIFTVNGVSATYKDRWLMDPANGTWGLLDADLPDLTNAASLSGNNTFTGDNTFSGKLNKNGSGYGYTLPSSTGLTGNSELLDTNSAQTIPGIKRFSSGVYFDDSSSFFIQKDGIDMLIRASGNSIKMRGNTRPADNNNWDLGGATLKWKDLYLSGQFKDGNNATYGLILPDSTNWTANKTIAIAENTVDLDSAQTITGAKTFTQNTTFNSTVLTDNIQAKSVGAIAIRSDLRSGGSAHDIGTSSYPFKDLHLAGKIKDGTNEFNADNVSNVINASDIVNNTLTQAQYDLITNGKPTLIKGTLLGLSNITLVYGSSSTNLYRILGFYPSSYGAIKAAIFNISSSYVISKYLDIFDITSNKFNLQQIGTINGKSLPAYPTTNTSRQYLSIAANGGALSWESIAAATSSVLGLVKLGSDTVVTANIQAVSTSNNRTYAIQVNSDGKMCVNVPWTDNELPSISGKAGKVLKVNANADGVEWANDTNTTYSAGSNIAINNGAISLSSGNESADKVPVSNGSGGVNWQSQGHLYQHLITLSDTSGDDFGFYVMSWNSSEISHSDLVDFDFRTAQNCVSISREIYMSAFDGIPAQIVFNSNTKELKIFGNNHSYPNNGIVIANIRAITDVVTQII